MFCCCWTTCMTAQLCRKQEGGQRTETKHKILVYRYCLVQRSMLRDRPVVTMKLPKVILLFLRPGNWTQSEAKPKPCWERFLKWTKTESKPINLTTVLTIGIHLLCTKHDTQKVTGHLGDSLEHYGNQMMGPMMRDDGFRLDLWTFF